MRYILSVFLLTILFYACKTGDKSKSPSGNEGNTILTQPPVDKYTAAIEAAPKNAENYFKRGNVLHKMAQDSLALMDYKKAVSIDSSKAEYLSAIGALLFDHKDISGSVSWLQRALQRDPSDVKSHLKLTKVMIFMGEYPKAFAEVNTVLRNDAFNPEGYFLKGIIYKEMKDTMKAISSFQTVMNVAPDYKEAMIQLGQLYNMKGNPIGMQYLDNAFRLDTTDLFPLYAKGMHYQEKKQYEQAKKEYRRCLEHDPQYADALFATGFILLQQDSFEKARRQFDLVTKSEPNNANAYYNRGLCSELMNQKSDAKKDYEQALVFDKDMKTAQEGLKRLSK